MPDLNKIVEWASEIGDLSYQVAPDPDPTGIQIRLRVQSIKQESGAGPVDPSPPTPEPAPAPAPLPDWMGVFCALLSAPEDEPQRRILQAWADCEGGLGHGNPFNVSAPLDRRWAWDGETGFWNNLGDGFGVATFDTVNHGAAACALNLLASRAYNGIVAAIRAGDAGAFANDTGLDTWGTGTGCVRRVLGV